VEENNCDHRWRAAGLWDGKDPVTLQRTGGVWYVCRTCGKRVNSITEARELGGIVDENTDVYGRPKKQGLV